MSDALAAPVYAFAGRSIEAVTCADRALRLSPFDLLAHQGHQARLMAAIQDARFDDAALHAARMVHANPGMSTDHFCLAISLALAGRLEEARPSQETTGRKSIRPIRSSGPTARSDRKSVV